MLNKIKDIFHLENPVYQPKNKYNIKTNEVSAGLGEFRLKDRDYFWLRVGKDDKFVYRINIKNAYDYVKKNPLARDNTKGTALIIVPLGKIGKKFKTYRRYSIQEYEDLRLENMDLRLHGLMPKYDS